MPLRRFFFFNDTATTEIYTLSLHDALPISHPGAVHRDRRQRGAVALPPDQPLVVGGHELAVAARERPVRAVGELRVVEGAPGALVDAHYQRRPELTRELPQAVGRGSRHGHAVLDEPLEHRLGAAVPPQRRLRRLVEPLGVAHEPRLAERDQARLLLRGTPRPLF